MYIFNTKVLDRDYTKLEVPLEPGFKSISEYGLGDNFYGGNVTHIANVKDSPIKLLLNNDDDHLKVVDVATDKLESIDTMSLKKYAKARNVEFNWSSATKDEIVNLLKPVLMQV